MFADIRDPVKGDEILATDIEAIINAIHILDGRPWDDGSEELIPFELYDDVAPGDTEKEAWTIKDGGSGVPARDAASRTIKVSDSLLGNVRAYGSNHSGISTGAKGWAVDLYGKHQIVAIQQQAKMCLCQLTAAQTGDDGSFDVDTVTPFSGQSPVASAEETLTVHNIPKCAGADDAVCCIEFNETAEQWQVMWVVNVEQTLVTAYQIDGATKKFQVKTCAAWINRAGDESGWTDVHTGGLCP